MTIATRSPGRDEATTPLLAPELEARVRQLQIRTHRLVTTALSGGYRSTFRGAGLEFEEVRQYLPGDDVRSIDWNVTARTGHPHVKIFTEERELTLELFVDTSRTMEFGSRGWTKREAVAQLAALIGFVALRNGDRFGVTLCGPRPGLHLEPDKTSRHVLRTIREVVAAEPTDGPTDLAAALRHHLRATHRRSVIFVISDFLPPRGDALTEPAWVEPLTLLSLKNDVVCARVVDPLEEQLPDAGLLDLAALSGGPPLEIDSGSKAVRAAWSRAADERRDTWRRAVTRARVDGIELRTDQDLAQPLIELFRRRQSRYGGRSV